jgi:hypothetical protein
MKKACLFGLFIVVVSLSVSAQGLYLDIGPGIGMAHTRIDGHNMSDELKYAGIRVSQIAFDFGLKAGYGFFSNIPPLYFVGELGGMWHRIYGDSDYMLFNSFMIGPGVLFYPKPLVQVGLSVGYSYTANHTNISSIDTVQLYNGSGFAWNISAGLNLSGKNHGCLIGAKFFNTNNTLKTSDVAQNIFMLGLFAKYTYRRAPSEEL